MVYRVVYFFPLFCFICVTTLDGTVLGDVAGDVVLKDAPGDGVVLDDLVGDDGCLNDGDDSLSRMVVCSSCKS